MAFSMAQGMQYPPVGFQATNLWDSLSLDQLFSLSFLASVFTSPSMWNGLAFFLLGTVIESGRRFARWLMDRVNFQWSVTARFDEGDPSYEWIVLFLTEHAGVWARTREFVVTAKNSKRKWGVKPGPEIDENADYVPTYEAPQLFKWNGYWVEVQRTRPPKAYLPPGIQQAGAFIYITIYTLNMKALSKFIAEARDGYKEISRPNVTVHTADQPSYGPGFIWNNAKHKARRPLSSIILLEGVIDDLVKDAQEFINTEQWYVDAGIPHRRGYLLHGPPGTGKSSTIYALAGELGLEIYTLSLSSGFVDDSYLQKAATSIPKHSIFLIEDIDCAFPIPRDAEDVEDQQLNNGMNNAMYGEFTGLPYHGGPKSTVTMSGLLNVLDGVASEEGKLFFATTNYVNRLDSALLRPGRIDRKIQYFFASRAQANALYRRFYDRPSGTSPTSPSPSTGTTVTEEEKAPEHTALDLPALAAAFAASIPEHEFSTAELQGFLLLHKQDPVAAAGEVGEWVEREKRERKEKADEEADKKRRAREKREEREARQFEGSMSKFVSAGGLGMQRGVQGGGAAAGVGGVSMLTGVSLAAAPGGGVYAGVDGSGPFGASGANGYGGLPVQMFPLSTSTLPTPSFGYPIWDEEALLVEARGSGEEASVASEPCELEAGSS